MMRRTMERVARKATVLVGVWQLLAMSSNSPFSLVQWNYVSLQRSLSARAASSSSSSGHWSYMTNSLNDIQQSLRAAWSDYAREMDPIGSLASSATFTKSNPVHCFNISYCCGVWSVNADHWYQHHPHWEIVLEDDNSFCFSASHSDPNRTAMLQHLHWTQWNINITDTTPLSDIHALSAALPEDYQYDVNCSNLCTTFSISSGYGASLQFLYSTFWYAFTRDIPYQITKRGPWLYATRDQNHSWAYCADEDTSCLFLPVSPCSRVQPDQPKIQRRPDARNRTQVLQSLWLRDYMIRPRQEMRHELYKLSKPYHSQLEHGCIALHVRRADAGVPRHPFRRYAAVAEYLDLLPQPKPGSAKQTIFLLTDDATTIEEVHKYHNGSDSPYQWVYTNKKRNRGVERGFDGHVPNGSDGPEELLYITMEQELASRYCDKFVHGNSGYAKILADKMTLKPEDHYVLDTTLPREEVAKFHGIGFRVREEHLLQQVEQFYANRTSASGASK